MTSAYSFSVNNSPGSLTAISDAAGNLVESLSYDPWGRRRNPNDWNDYNVTSTLFDRGFTGHEHLPQFGLINMNGRVYDPFLARFLSPDPFVQAPGNPQNYNRYTYALNNPLKYTDPSGYTFKPDDWDKGFGGAISYTPMQAGYQGNIGPGSSNHWSDPFRSEWGNFMLGNESSFNRIYGQGAYGSALKVWGDEDARQLWISGQQSLRKGIWVNEIRINPYNVSISGNVVSYDGGPEVINKFVRFTGKSGTVNGNAGQEDELGLMKDIGSVADYASGVIGLIQIGMLKYRMTLPTMSKVGSFSNFASWYGILGKFGGRLSYAGSGISLISNISEVRSGEIGLSRFSYRLGSLGTAVGTGVAIGGAWGAVGGAAVGGISVGAEYIYDNILIPLGNEIQYQIWNFENAIKNGWYPGK